MIVTGNTPFGTSGESATSTIPIVFASGGDPVGAGLVASLARPGGNLTGVTFLTTELTPKRLELLSELVPRRWVIALLVNPNNASSDRLMPDGRKAAREGSKACHPGRPAPKARSTPLSPPSSNGAGAPSSAAISF